MNTADMATKFLRQFCRFAASMNQFDNLLTKFSAIRLSVS
jgi:hypothetical protein